MHIFFKIFFWCLNYTAFHFQKQWGFQTSTFPLLSLEGNFFWKRERIYKRTFRTWLEQTVLPHCYHYSIYYICIYCLIQYIQSDPSSFVPATAILLLSKWHTTRQKCRLKYIAKSSLASFEIYYCVEWDWSFSGNTAKDPERFERIQSVYESEASITTRVRKIKWTCIISPYY